MNLETLLSQIDFDCAKCKDFMKQKIIEAYNIGKKENEVINPNIKTIRGLSGFGDSIYLRPILEYFEIATDYEFTVYSNYPDIFNGLTNIFEVLPFKRTQADYVLSYLSRKHDTSTNQFEDLLLSGNLPNIRFSSKLKRAEDRRYTLVIPLYYPMGINNEKNRTMIPKEKEYVNLIKKYYNIRYLEDKLPFSELVKIFNGAYRVICQVGWAVPMAEMLDIPTTVCFTERALNYHNSFISSIVPEKILTKPTSTSVIME